MSKPSFRYYLRVRYGECDAQKVVFNARYGDYVDIAMSEFCRALGFGDALVSGQIDFQLVKQTLEWKSPARYDQVLEISVAALRLGNTSFTVGMELRMAGSDRILATAETVYVMVAPHSLEKIAIPADFRAALDRGTSAVIDHAAYLGA